MEVVVYFSYFSRFFSTLFSSTILFVTLSPHANATDGIRMPMDIQQGFKFQKYTHTPFGYLTHLNIAGKEYPKSMTINNPSMANTPVSVTGVLSAIRWNGGSTHPVVFTAQLPTDAMQMASLQVHNKLNNTRVNLSFVVYKFDKALNRYKLVFEATNVKGVIQQDGGTLEFEIDSDPSPLVNIPKNYEFYLSVIPEDTQKQHLIIKP